MHKTLIGIEKRDFHRLVDVSRHYAGGDLNKCYVFNKKGYTAEMYKEKVINGVNCIVFGWSNYKLNMSNLDDGMCGYDLTGILFHLKKSKRGYILMEFENEMLVNFRDDSKIPELAKAMNLDKIITRNDFEIVFNEENKEKEDEEEYE